MTPLPDDVHAAAVTLWAYHRLGHTVERADGILVFGSNDLRVARHAADLFKAGLAPWILFSGARGRMTEHWPVTEAEAMAGVALEEGVPASAILLEPRATNTGENIRFSQALLAERGLPSASLIVVQKPYMERRTLAALDVQWPGSTFKVSSPDLSFDDYCTEELGPDFVIEAMTADFQRILDYPALGFASVQPVDDEVMAAHRVLTACVTRRKLV